MDNYINECMDNYIIAVLVIFLALTIAIVVLMQSKSKPNGGTTSDSSLTIEDKSIYAILSIVLGTIFARVYYYLCDMTNIEATFMGVQGKLSLYGVLLGIVVAAILVCVIRKRKLSVLIESMVTPALIMLIGARVADFFLGSNYGRVIENESFMTFPFGVYIKYNVGGAWLVAVFMYELIAACILLLISIISKRKKAIYILGVYSLVRVITESLRQDALYVGFVKISQIIAIVLALFALSYYTITIYKKNIISTKSFVGRMLAALVMVVIGFLCEFFMGTEVEVLYTVIMAVCMTVVGALLTGAWLKVQNR